MVAPGFAWCVLSPMVDFKHLVTCVDFCRSVPNQRALSAMANFKCLMPSFNFLQKVPPTTVAPTYKLTLPSEFVLTHMEDMMASDFVMTSADGTQSFAVSIVPRYAIGLC